MTPSPPLSLLALRGQISTSPRSTTASTPRHMSGVWRKPLTSSSASTGRCSARRLGVRRRYYGGGVSSVYLWQNDTHLCGCFLILKGFRALFVLIRRSGRIALRHHGLLARAAHRGGDPRRGEGHGGIPSHHLHSAFPHREDRCRRRSQTERHADAPGSWCTRLLTARARSSWHSRTTRSTSPTSAR